MIINIAHISDFKLSFDLHKLRFLAHSI